MADLGLVKNGPLWLVYDYVGRVEHSHSYAPWLAKVLRLVHVIESIIGEDTSPLVYNNNG